MEQTGSKVQSVVKVYDTARAWCYQTFENTGQRRWPLGYNPKPLIAKSIRNLAMQYTEQKLVSLRRT